MSGGGADRGLLGRAAASLRDDTAPDGDGERRAPAADQTLARVLGTVRRSRRRRRLVAMMAVQLAVAGVGLGAWAAASGRLRPTLERLAERIGLRPTTSPPAPTRPGRAARPVAPPLEAPAPAAPVAPAAAPAQSPAPSAARPRPPRLARRASSPAPESTDDLYRHAHQAHFQRRDWAAALDAWNRYLAAPEVGRFALEARYNRAIALLRLGRGPEAADALRPFAEGDYGGYRQAEARALLNHLAPPGPRPPP
jgi:hypothetical protein